MKTNWDRAAGWYDDLVGETGSEYQQKVVFPGVLQLLGVKPGDKVLDVACGQGVFSRVLLDAKCVVTGIDASSNLVRTAVARSAGRGNFLVQDATRLSLPAAGKFDAAVCILAIQDIERAEDVFKSIAGLLRVGGRLVLAMMHPCFRTPKSSSWGWDEAKRVQYRRVEGYLSRKKLPVFTNPGADPGKYTWTFHRPLSFYVKSLAAAGLCVDAMDEWTSHKVSTSGPKMAAENMARKEIPLFLGVRAVLMPPVPSRETPAGTDSASAK